MNKIYYNLTFFILLALSIYSLCQDNIIAQQQPETTEFPVGSIINLTPTNRTNQALYDSFKATGMNTIVCYADESTKNFVSDLKVIPWNDPTNNEWISYYVTGYYSKWQAEENQSNDSIVGVKHRHGQEARWRDTLSWSTIGLTGPVDSLIFGPHYHQEKFYRRFQVDNTQLTFTPRFRMALQRPQQINESENVCIIKVVHRYKIYYNNQEPTFHETIYLQRTLKISDFNSDGSFKDIYFGESPISAIYQYDSQFPISGGKDKMLQIQPDTSAITDSKEDTGIQFCLDWLRNDTLCTLYIDYAEVYDNDGWNALVEDSLTAAVAIQNIKDYAQDYSGWGNIKYWYGHDEPLTIDAITPMRVVDSLVRFAGGAPLITAFLVSPPPIWSPTNGEWLYRRIYEATNPEKLMIDYYPYYVNRETPVSLEILRTVLTETHMLQPGFWYFGQAFGLRTLNNDWCNWRKPDSMECKASVMLSLAHGVKGLLFWSFESGEGYYDWDDCHVKREGILGENLTRTDLWYIIRDNFAPRLKGTLGKTLLGLNYTGNYLQLKYITPTQNPLPQPPTFDYLTIGLQASNHDMNWHVGFFDHPSYADNKYFLMANLWTNSSKSLQVKVTPPVQGYTNYRFRNIESANNFDITFNTETTQILNFPAGEGYLFQVAPVVKYGGKLVYNETVTDGMTLYEDMSIENGVTLTINGRYYANADITVKAGGKLKYGDDNSKIIFSNGAKLILDGNALVYGTSSSNKLNLQYDASTSIGVVVNPGASPIISYCNITGPSNGISVENEATINISNTSISNCSNTGIALFHFGNGESSSTLSTPNIYKCSITNCGTAISTVNCSEVIIKENTITQCNLGLYFNMVNSAYISSNTILGWQSATGSPMPGISMSSSGGYLRNNTIRYHNYGVLLAYASPDLGVNTIEYNYKCGVYSSLGSYPNLVQQLAYPECWYPIGGCNVIKNNGTFPHLPPSSPSTQPDGAEIFLNSGDVLLSYGFNEISDDRTGIPTYLTLPLIKGTRSTGGSREFFVDHNYYGTVGPSPTRFGTLEADYDPTAEYCPLPDAPCSGSEIIIQTTDGQIIDTLDSRERETTEITALEENYANADKLFYSGEIEEAKTYYLTIVQGYYTNAEKLYAYNKLYEIGALLKEEDAYFTELQNAFNSILEVETDTLLLKAFNQRAILCDVSKEEYVTAINKFDTIIQQNPNSEEAVYAEIDIITTALKMDTTNSGLGKIGGGKYLVKGTTDYLSKLNNILQSKFGINDEDKEQIIPKEYSLYQNYPNPFNPTTTIKFDIPASLNPSQGGTLRNVTLKVYDILGREIVTLVDEPKNEGRYEVIFNASSLASGVYVYKLQAGDFVSSKKMILLK